MPRRHLRDEANGTIRSEAIMLDGNMKILFDYEEDHKFMLKSLLHDSPGPLRHDILSSCCFAGRCS